MIKQHNRLSIFYLITLGTLELASLVGAYLLSYFTRTKLGMLRHMVYLNGRWEESLPIFEIKVIFLSVLTLLFVLTIVRYIKLDKALKNNMYNLILTIYTILLTLFTALFVYIYNTSDNRAYYPVAMLFIIATIFQHGFYQCFLSFISKRKRRSL